jgi:HAD superfamily hydrolase (TIGR01549 family)
LPYSFKKTLEMVKLLKINDLSDKQVIEELRTKSYQELMDGDFKMAWFKIPIVILMIKKTQIELGKIIETVELFPGVKEFLLELKKEGYNLSIISSNMKSNIDKFLEFNGINVFDFIHGKTDLLGKAEAIEKFVKDYKLEKSEVVYVGDEIRDVTASHKAGIKMIGVTWGLHKVEALKKNEVDYIVNTPREIMKIIGI